MHAHDHRQLSLAAGSEHGLRVLRWSAAGLALTALIQVVVVGISGSVALLADTLHNIGDVGTTVVLWIAFRATTRAADHRYTFGYARFEDLAGLVVVLAILVSSVAAAYEAVQHLVHRAQPHHLALGIAAGLVGMAGNEAVAIYKIRAGKRIGSPSLVAEGRHSRVDGLTSAGVVVGLTGVALGAAWADGVAGLAIAAAILVLGGVSAKPIVARLADRIDPAVIERIARLAADIGDVRSVHDIRARWAGRGLYVLLHIEVPADMRVDDAHEVGERVRRSILHTLEQVAQVDVHVDPFDTPHAHNEH